MTREPLPLTSLISILKRLLTVSHSKLSIFSKRLNNSCKISLQLCRISRKLNSCLNRASQPLNNKAKTQVNTQMRKFINITPKAKYNKNTHCNNLTHCKDLKVQYTLRTQSLSPLSNRMKQFQDNQTRVTVFEISTIRILLQLISPVLTLDSNSLYTLTNRLNKI